MKIHIIKNSIGQIEYSIKGQGVPVLFIHGGHSNCKETLCHKGFDTSKYQLITPSRPGYGNTPLSDKTTPQKTAEFLVALLDYLQINKVVLYGISAGGPIAISIAAIYPERVEKLILASAVSKKWLTKNGKQYKAAKKLFNTKTESFVWAIIRMFSAISPRMIAKSFYPQFSKFKPHKLKSNDIDELVHTFKHFRSKQGFMSDIDHDIPTELLFEIVCPTLIIHSINDNSVTFDHAEHSNKMITNSELIKLNNEWGHLIWIGKDSEATISKITEFIER